MGSILLQQYVIFLFLYLCSMNVSQGFDAEKAGSNGLTTSVVGNGKNGNVGGFNGNGVVGPLPPDGMYHVSDINGGGNTNIDMIHGSLTDKVNSQKSGGKFIMPSSTCV